MPVDPRFKVSGLGLKRDIRPWTVRTVEWMQKPDSAVLVLALIALHLVANSFIPNSLFPLEWSWSLFDLLLLGCFLYFRWFMKQNVRLPFKLPSYTQLKDPNNPAPGKSSPGKAEGILFLGNVRGDSPMKGEELWLTNSDARTHILFLGTTGAGKTEGLKSLATNALTWGSGFVYVDGKAQNTLWGDIYSLARRFGRDDDLLVLNYMTGNSDVGSQSNSLNPFSIGSASYLTQMMVSMMDDAGEDNAMWKGRAIALMSALMPALTWKRDNQGLLLDVGVIRDNLTMQQIIKMSRDAALPDKIIRGLQSYLDTLPGFVDSAFDDEGNERPQTNDQPMVDLSQTRQQHGYLTMQFTRALQSLADEYGYIFKQQQADISMMDVVLNRRILVVLIPALEKSPDEAANLGKIVVAALKGMMGATLGAQIEGAKETMLDNNPTESRSPFITIFDEVGYYTSPGMGVMAAQARSLGFSLVFASQDLPAMQKRVKEEAMSITGNCNLKIFGKLEDPTETRDFFEKTVSTALVSEVSGFSAVAGVSARGFADSDNISVQSKKEASYDDLRRQTQGQVHFLWADKVISADFFYANPPKVQSIRVQRFLPVSNKNWSVETRDRAIADVAAHLKDVNWKCSQGAVAPAVREITLMLESYRKASASKRTQVMAAAASVGALGQGAQKSATEAVPANLGGGQSSWPLGAPEAPSAPSTSPLAAPPSAPPSWMTQSAPAAAPPPVQSAPPPPVGGSASTPSWMMAPPAQPAPVAGSPPPWAAGPTPPQQQGYTPPYSPPQQQQSGYGQASYGQPPYGQQQSGYNSPPPYAPQQQKPPVPPPYGSPPPWAGAPVSAAPPPPQAPYGGTPLPPWAGGGMLQQPQQQQQSYATPPGSYGAPPQNYAPPPGAYNPPQQHPPSAPPPWAGAPAAPPQQSSYAPPPPVQGEPDQAPEIDAVLRNAAENLAGEMFPDGKTPPEKRQ